jgi:hypothetical protein
LAAILMTTPAAATAEPIRFTSGRFFIDYTESPAAGEFDAVASGASVALSIVGSWSFGSRPLLGDRFVHTTFFGAGSSDTAELRLADRIILLNSPTFDLSILGPRIQRPPAGEDQTTFVRFPGLLVGSISGVSDEGMITMDVSGRGEGFHSFKPNGGLIDSGFSWEDTAPIPEPATILLISVAGVIAVARERNLAKRKQSGS